MNWSERPEHMRLGSETPGRNRFASPLPLRIETMRRDLSQRIVTILLPFVLLYLVGYQVAYWFGWL